jgi:tryptophanyl-tRNA synthetase
MLSPMADRRPRVLSGIQPSGGLHIGNYLGALRNWVADQDRYENYFCIVDLHALTVVPDADDLRRRILDLAALYLACGLDPERCEIFVQSQVPAHAQLGWIMECFSPMGWLERMTQFKAKAQGPGRERVGVGVFTYPALMAADIVLYDADRVPVGDDQRQHVEYCRDVVQRINSLRGEVLKMPEPLIRTEGARIMGLDDPTVKMSKSVGVERPAHAVFMLDAPDAARKKIMRATTDSKPAVEAPLGEGVANLVDIYAATVGISQEAALAELTGKPYGELKRTVADAVVSALEPIQRRFHELRDDPAELDRLLRASAQRVSLVAEETLSRVYRAVGLR